MTAPLVLTTRAEESTARLFRTMAAHRTTMLSLQPTRAARIGGPWSHEARVQERRQATLIRLVSIVESFASELVWREVEREVAGPSGQPDLATCDRCRDRKHFDLGAARDVHTSPSLESCRTGKPIGSLAEARNAAAHGFGMLTRRQHRNLQSTTTRIGNANIVVDDGRILITEDNVERIYPGRRCIHRDT